MKRNVALLLTAALVLLCFVACSSSASTTSSKSSLSQQSTQTEQPGVETQGERPVITLTTIVDERNPLDATNFAINYIQEKANVTLAFNVLPNVEVDTKLNLMLSSGAYGDVLVAPMSATKLSPLIKDGIVIPVTEYYNSMSVEYKKILEARPSYKKFAYYEDGEMYGFLKSNEAYHCTIYPKLWFNYDWIDKLNLTIPTTTDEFYNVLVAIRDGDPNENGIKDEIPLTGSAEFACPLEYYLMNSFIPTDRITFAYAKDGNVVFAADKEEYREGLRYLKKLLDESLIDKANFTQKADQMQQVIRQEPSRVAGYTADHFAMGIDLNDRQANENLFALPPVKGPYGYGYVPSTDFSDMEISYSWMITDLCKNPESAYHLGDFLMNEEVNICRSYGVEGEGWGKLESPVPSVLGYDATYWTKAQYSSNSDDDSYYKNTLFIEPWNNLVEVRELSNPMPDDLFTPESYEARLAIETQKLESYKYKEYLPRYVYQNLTLVEQEEFMETRTLLTDYVKTSTTQFITGELSIDKDWDSYVNQLKTYNLDRYLKVYQECFDKLNNR